MALCRSNSTQERCPCFTEKTYDGIDYNEHRVNLHLSPRGAHWKAFSAHYIIPPLASSIYRINISIHSLCNVLSSDPGLTIPEFVFILYYSQPAAQLNICLANLH